MSIVKVEQIWPGRGGDSEGIDATTAVRRYRITTDDKHDTEQTIAASGLLPARHSALPENIFLTLRRLSLENIQETPRVWEATLTYSSEPIDQEREERDLQPNPLLRRRTLEWTTNQYREGVLKDRDNKAVVNSAGDFFDPPPEKDASYWVASISKNVAQVPAFMAEVDNPINEDDVDLGGITWPAGTFRLSNLRISDEQKENGYSFFVLSYQLEYRKAGWALKIPDNGMREKDPGDSTKRIHIKDDNEEPVTSPVLLDGSGNRLADPSPDNAVNLTFDIYEELDFTTVPGILS